MHDLQSQLEKLTRKDTSKNLVDQQNHLEALWNHLSRRLSEKQRIFKSRCINMLKNSEFQSKDVMPGTGIIVDRWLRNLKDAVRRLELIPDLLDLTKDVDISSLKHIFMVCLIKSFTQRMRH